MTVSSTTSYLVNLLAVDSEAEPGSVEYRREGSAVLRPDLTGNSSQDCSRISHSLLRHTLMAKLSVRYLRCAECPHNYSEALWIHTDESSLLVFCSECNSFFSSRWTSCPSRPTATPFVILFLFNRNSTKSQA